MNKRAAAIRCGYSEKSADHTANALMKHYGVRREIIRLKRDQLFRVNVTADQVLQGLWSQYQRLLAMLAADWADLYDEDGSFLPVTEWPELWRTAMLSGIEVEKMFERSKVGGQSSWDEAGTVTKIKRESRIAIEKQITDTLAQIGKHTSVDAWMQTKPGDTNIMVVTADTARKVSSARARLAKVVDVTGEGR